MSARKYWLGFNVVKGVGPVRLRALRAAFGDLGAAWSAPEPDLLAAGLDRRTVESLIQARSTLDLDRLLDEVDAAGASVLTLDDPDYPALLRELPDSPPVLYVKGTLLDEDRWAVAFVGTRRATAYGRDMAHRLATSLVSAGITIVSGLALGIDAAAHKAALEAGGRTIAVLGCGIDQVYPPEHRHLAAAIANSGALVSEFPLGTQPEAKNFPVRNRLISGLSLGVVVVEAPADSGALITADCAIEQGRDVFAVPGNVTARTTAGTHRLIQNGAKLVVNGDDILDELNLTRSTVETRTQVRAVAPDTPLEVTLADLLGGEPLHIDELVRRSGLTITEVSSTLALMELKGIVHRQEGMMYALALSGAGQVRLD